MAKQAIETRLERLENEIDAGQERVVLAFNGDPPRQWPAVTTVIQVSFVESTQTAEALSHDDQAAR